MSGGTFGTNWLDLSSTSNRYVRTYIQGFMDISGGNLIVRNNNLYLTQGDASINGNLYLANRMGLGVSGSFGVYDVCNNAQMVLDVSGGVNLRGPVMGGLTLPDNSVMMTATPPLDLSNGFGSVWTQATFGAAKLWYLVSMSANGQYQTAVVKDDYIYTSNNFGASWTQDTSVGSVKDWGGVSMSANGQCQIAFITSGTLNRIYQSNNYGVTWTVNTSLDSAITANGSWPTDSSARWTEVCMSATGQYQGIVSYAPSRVLRSNDYGVTWLIDGYTFWAMSMTISATGQYQSICHARTGGIWTSNNYGVSFTVNSSTRSTDSADGMTKLNWYSIKISATGRYQTAVVGGFNTNNAHNYTNTMPGSIYTSHDFGATWTERTSAPTNVTWQSVSMSANGEYQVACHTTTTNAAGYIYKSKDYGVTWSLTNSGNQYWRSVSMSADGQYVTAHAEYIYRSITPYNDLVASNSLIAYCDASLNRRLYVTGDVSFGGKLSVASSLSANAGLTVNNGILTANSGLTVNNVLLTATNGLTVNNTILTATAGLSVTGGVSLPTGSIADGALSTNVDLINVAKTFTAVKTFNAAPVMSTITNGSATLTLPTLTGTLATLTGSETLTNKTITTSGLLTANGGLTVTGDTTSNRLLVSSDSSFNGNVYMDDNLLIRGNLSVQQYRTNLMVYTVSYGFIVGEDMSLNGRLYLYDDLSANKRMFLGGDASFGGKLFVASDLSVNGRLNVRGDTTATRLLVSSDASFANIDVNGVSAFSNGVIKFAALGTASFADGDIALGNGGLATFTKANTTIGSSGIVMGSSTTANFIIGGTTLANAKASITNTGDISCGGTFSCGGSMNAYGTAASRIGNFKVGVNNITYGNDTALTNVQITSIGGATFTGQVNAASFNATSDYRIKTGVRTLDNSYNVNLLKPVVYNNEKLNKKDIGFLAHEVQEQYPFLVDGEKDGENLQTLNYIGIIGILTKEIQELKKENVKIIERLERLEKTSTDL